MTVLEENESTLESTPDLQRQYIKTAQMFKLVREKREDCYPNGFETKRQIDF